MNFVGGNDINAAVADISGMSADDERRFRFHPRQSDVFCVIGFDCLFSLLHKKTHDITSASASINQSTTQKNTAPVGAASPDCSLKN
jgi:hypothetical protein